MFIGAWIPAIFAVNNRSGAVKVMSCETSNLMVLKPIANYIFCLLVTCVSLTLSSCTSPKPQQPVVSEAQIKLQQLNRSKTYFLISDENGIPDIFRDDINEIISGFSLLPAPQSEADLIIQIGIDGNVIEKLYMVQTETLPGMLVVENKKLPVGFKHSGYLSIQGKTKNLFNKKLYASNDGPGAFYNKGNSKTSIKKEAIRSKELSYQAFLGDICSALMHAFPNRLPLLQIKSGSEKTNKACLEWQENDDQRKQIIETILKEETDGELIARAIDSATERDLLDLSIHVNLQHWILDKNSRIQKSAALKLVELNDGRPLKHWRHDRLNRYNMRKEWILDAIPLVNTETRVILVKKSEWILKGSGKPKYPTKNWINSCVIENKQENVLKELFFDHSSEIRGFIAKSHFPIRYDLLCEIVDRDTSKNVTDAAKHRLNDHDCSCGRDVSCFTRGKSIRKAKNDKELKAATRVLIGEGYPSKLFFNAEPNQLVDELMFARKVLRKEKIKTPEANIVSEMLERVILHCDEKVRKAAVERISYPPRVLEMISKNDPSEIVRITASRKLNN